MSISNDPLHKRRIDRLKYELNLDKAVIEKILSLNFEYIRKKLIVEDFDNSKLLTKEEFDNQLPIIKIPVLGYFTPNYYKYRRIYKNRINKELNKNK